MTREEGEEDDDLGLIVGDDINTECAMSSPAGNDATDIVAIEVDSDDSPLSSASPEVVRLPLWVSEASTQSEGMIRCEQTECTVCTVENVW